MVTTSDRVLLMTKPRSMITNEPERLEFGGTDARSLDDCVDLGKLIEEGDQ